MLPSVCPFSILAISQFIKHLVDVCGRSMQTVAFGHVGSGIPIFFYCNETSLRKLEAPKGMDERTFT